jgi:hypothetical protein
MERLFSIGLVVGIFISGVACLMVSISQQVGIGLIAVATIWVFLFVCPKSPVKMIWWSVSCKLGITLADDSEMQIGVNEENFTIRIGLIAVPSIQIDKISLKIGHTRLWASNWTPMEVKAVESQYINFTKPLKFGKGRYDASLCAHTPDGFSKSKKFFIKFS